MPFITLCNVLLDQSDRPLYCYGPNFLCEFRIPTAQTFGDCKVVRISYIETIVGYLVVYRYREKFQVVSVGSSEIFLCPTNKLSKMKKYELLKKCLIFLSKQVRGV